MKSLYFLPAIIFVIVVVYLVKGLELAEDRGPSFIPSVLINTPVTNFNLDAISGQQKGLSYSDLIGKVSIVNVFASWCEACKYEHNMLMKIKAKGRIPIYGINWKERDRSSGPAWLRRYGNPYKLIGDDPNSVGAIAFGVTKAPESFVIDTKGFIRLKRTGPITPEYWKNTMLPIIKGLNTQ